MVHIVPPFHREMKVKANVFVEGASGKILVRYGEGGLNLPSIIACDDRTLKDHLTDVLVGLGIGDVVEDDIVLYNFDDVIDGEHIIFVTFKVRTRAGSVPEHLNYKFLTLSALKDSLDKFENPYDSFVTRLYILNPYN